MWELSGNLKLTEIHKIISNESEKFEQSSTLNASLLKKLIDEIKDKAIKKRQEIMNNIRRIINNSNTKEIESSATTVIMKAVSYWKDILCDSESVIEELNQSLYNFIPIFLNHFIFYIFNLEEMLNIILNLYEPSQIIQIIC